MGKVLSLRPSEQQALIEKFIQKQPRSVVVIVEQGAQILSVSRRNQPNNLALPGGKIDPGELPEHAAKRELSEETGLEAQAVEFCYERVDPTDGRIAWCYKVTSWSGHPRQMESGIEVKWVDPYEFLAPNCTFAEYNRGLFMKLGYHV